MSLSIMMIQVRPFQGHGTIRVAHPRMVSTVYGRETERPIPGVSIRNRQGHIEYTGGGRRGVLARQASMFPSIIQADQPRW